MSYSGMMNYMANSGVGRAARAIAFLAAVEAVVAGCGSLKLRTPWTTGDEPAVVTQDGTAIRQKDIASYACAQNGGLAESRTLLNNAKDAAASSKDAEREYLAAERAFLAQYSAMRSALRKKKGMSLAPDDAGFLAQIAREARLGTFSSELSDLVRETCK